MAFSMTLFDYTRCLHELYISNSTLHGFKGHFIHSFELLQLLSLLLNLNQSFWDDIFITIEILGKRGNRCLFMFKKLFLSVFARWEVPWGLISSCSNPTNAELDPWCFLVRRPNWNVINSFLVRWKVLLYLYTGVTCSETLGDSQKTVWRSNLFKTHR